MVTLSGIVCLLVGAAGALAVTCPSTHDACPWTSINPGTMSNGAACASSGTWNSIKKSTYNQDCCDGSSSGCYKGYPVLNSDAYRTYNEQDETFKCSGDGSKCIVTTTVGGPTQTTSCCN